jgi:hypothetical protein
MAALTKYRLTNYSAYSSPIDILRYLRIMTTDTKKDTTIVIHRHLYNRLRNLRESSDVSYSDVIERLIRAAKKER